MKHFILIFYFTGLFFGGLGQNISEEKAVKAASHFLFDKERPVKHISLYGTGEKPGIYVINFEPEGWALISGSENARPVIGYSHSGFFDAGEATSNVKDWLDNAASQIANSGRSSMWAREWEILRENGLPELKSATAVEPLLKTEWDQGAGWNRFCPDYEDGPDGKAYVGCVAVAMAQALHHIKFPRNPSGNKSYALEPYGFISVDFDKEPVYEWSKMSATSPDDHNARLLYHCAVAVEMDFGGSGSGAYTTRVPFAFQRYFGFTPAVKTIARYKNDDEWIALLKSELDKNNVLIYSGNPGNSQAGHAFNIDGYSASGYFHFNWGWGGTYDGYYSIHNVAPGNEDFTKNQEVVTGISRPYWGPTDILLSSQYINENMPAGTVVGNISVTDYSANDKFTFEVFGAPLFLEGGYAPAKFYEENLQLKSLEPLTSGAYPEVATIRVTDSEGNEFEKRFEIIVRKFTTSNNPAASDDFSVFPNPAKNALYVRGTSEPRFFRIINITGETVLYSGEYNGGIDISVLQNGTYILEYSVSESRRYFHLFVVQK